MDEWTRESRLQKEFFRTLILVAIFTLVSGCMIIGQMVSDQLFERYVRHVNITESQLIMRSAGTHWLDIQGGNVTLAVESSGNGDGEEYAMEPLRDVVFQILPDWSRMRGWLPDALLVPLVAANIFVNVAWRPRPVMRYQGWIVLRRFLLILTLLYVFRTVTFIVTTVPSPMDDCRPMYVKSEKSNPGEAFSSYLILFGRMASGKVTACTDNIYSGHTSLISVSAWMFMQYTGGIWWLQGYALAHAAAALVSILLTRLHYTVDVIVAMIIASFVYITVHYLIQFAMDDLVPAPVTPGGDRGCATEAVKLERRLLERINSGRLLRMVRWLDGMDLRMPREVEAKTSAGQGMVGLENE